MQLSSQPISEAPSTRKQYKDMSEDEKGEMIITAVTGVAEALKQNSGSRDSVSDTIIGPNAFTGSAQDREGAENWLELFFRYVTFKRFSPEKSLGLFKMLMREAASDWLQTLSMDVQNSLDALVAEFKTTYFKSPELKWADAGRLFKEPQKTGERVDDYLIRVRKAARRLNIAEEFLHYVIINGLLPHIRTHVVSRGIGTMDDTIKAARIAECSLAADPITSLLVDTISTNKAIADKQQAALAALTEQVQELTVHQSQLNAVSRNADNGEMQSMRDNRQQGGGRGNFTRTYRNQAPLTPFP